MKHVKWTTICFGLMLVVLATAQADASWLRKSKKRTEKTAEESQPRRFDRNPTMQFKGGILSCEPHSGWKIGNTLLSLTEDCVITAADAEDATLLAGRQAIAMGPIVGGVIRAWSVHISPPGYQMLGQLQSEEPREPGSNPNVGKIVERLE